jgi:carbonic anhydrase
LGLELGDAIVARNVGGRVIPAVLADLAWISFLHETKTPGADWFELAIVHHTDCGSGFFADEQVRHDFAERTSLDERGLAELAVLDPAQTVAADVRKVLDYLHASSKIKISGYAYDVKSGRINTVVSPRSRAA